MVELTVQASGRRIGSILLLLLLLPIAPIATAYVPVNHSVMNSQTSPMSASIPRHVSAHANGFLPGAEVNPFLFLTQEPAPMGIADYGVGPSSPYEYATNSSLGLAYIVSLSTMNSTGKTDMSMQLNVNLKFTVNAKLYVYWVQDVVYLNTTSNLIYFENNIWNFTSHSAEMSNSSISGSGIVYQAGSDFYYAAGATSEAGNGVNLSFPAQVELEVDTGMSGSNQPQVAFSFNDGYGRQTFDTATFLTSGKVALSGFVVDGSNYNPMNLFYDSEFILGGAGGGLQTQNVASDVRMQLYYFNGHNIQLVSNAYNFGSDTAEGIGNTLSQGYYYPSDGELIAEVQNGPGTLEKLYDSSQVGQIKYTSQYASGTLEIRNASDPSATPDDYGFVGGQAIVTIYPGQYLLQLSENSVVTNLGTYAVNAGQITSVSSQNSSTQLTLSYAVQGGGSGYSAPILTYVNNGQIANASLTTTPAIYNVDTGTSWSISSSLPGSSSTERWATNQPTNGTASSSKTIQFVYQHQYMLSIAYSIQGGGSPSPPQLSYVTFSIPRLVPLKTAAQPFWADAGTSYSVPSQLAGSSSNERWEVVSNSGTAQKASSFAFIYYHQDFVITLYAVSGGGSGYGTPTIQCSQFGSPIGAQQGSSIWADAGSTCTYSPILPGSTSTIRWAASSPDAKVISPGSILLTYYHQYSVNITYGIVGGGSPEVPTLTGLAFGVTSTILLASASAQEWLDVGSAFVMSNLLSPSSAGERWYTTTVTSGVLNNPLTISATYYHQYFISAAFAVVGGGTPSAPALSYVTLGNPTSIQLGTASQAFWADSGSRYSAPAELNGSASERWSSPSSSGRIQGPSTLNLVYSHQFLLSITGAGLTPTWRDAGSTASVSVDGVFGRASGSGQRVTSYSVDGGPASQIQPTANSFTVSILMDKPHELSISSVTQYEVSLDSNAMIVLGEWTQPTIPTEGSAGQSSYWYDSGSKVEFYLHVTMQLTNESQYRLVSFTLNSEAPVIVQLSEVGGTENVLMPVFTESSLSGPESISADLALQYLLSMTSGSVRSATAPPITGDTGWYDRGTSTTIVYNYSWNATASGSRENTVAYSIDGKQASLARSGNGTFTVEVTMLAPHSVSVAAVTQYLLTLSGGNSLSLSNASPTGDGFYDEGSVLAVTTDYTWGLVNGNERQSLESFTLDSSVTNTTEGSTGSFTTPNITFDGPHTLVLTSATQDLVTFVFKDGSGTHAITPTSVRIQVEDPTVINVPPSGVWLNNGTRFQLYDIEWQGVDVKPANQTVYTVTAPLNQTVLSRVYSGRIVTTDYLGIPISGAKVSITLANGTVIAATTGSDGSVDLGEIPLGSYTAKVAYLGTTSQVTGDAAASSTGRVQILSSYPTFGMITVALATAVVAIAVVVRRRHAGEVTSPKVPANGPLKETPSVLEVVCPHCMTANLPTADFCQECGKSLQ